MPETMFSLGSAGQADASWVNDLLVRAWTLAHTPFLG